MNFTREPIIETVITPREGCKLVVRGSKGQSQEDYFVDAIEVVSFGHSFFFRSLEKPKSFLVPVSDYEILELRETRMVLKHVPSERSVKISGGRDAAPSRPQREQTEKPEPKEHKHEAREKHQDPKPGRDEAIVTAEEIDPAASTEAGAISAGQSDRKRDGRRRRGRRGRSDRPADAKDPSATPTDGSEALVDESASNEVGEATEQNLAHHVERSSEPAVQSDRKENSIPTEAGQEEKAVKPPSLLSRLFLPAPPRNLIPRMRPAPVAEVQPVNEELEPPYHPEPIHPRPMPRQNPEKSDEKLPEDNPSSDDSTRDFEE